MERYETFYPIHAHTRYFVPLNHSQKGVMALGDGECCHLGVIIYPIMEKKKGGRESTHPAT